VIASFGTLFYPSLPKKIANLFTQKYKKEQEQENLNWQWRGYSKIDLLVQYSNKIIPIEVKAAENLQAKSLKTFCQKYNPKTVIRTSLSDYRKETWLTNIPLYIIGNYFENKT